MACTYRMSSKGEIKRCERRVIESFTVKDFIKKVFHSERKIDEIFHSD